MIQLLMKNWGLLAVCSVLDSMISVTYFNHAENGIHTLKAVEFLGELTIAAGACTIAAGIWNSASPNRWLRILDGLVLDGLACVALGLVLTFWTGGIAFRTVALLIIVMSVSLGVDQSVTARSLPRPDAAKWLHGAAGEINKLDPTSSAQTFVWLGSYFGFSGICMLGIALREQREGHSRSGQPADRRTLANPRQAH